MATYPGFGKTLRVVSGIREVVMKALVAAIALTAATVTPVSVSATQHNGIDGSAMAIRDVIAGKTCMGKDVLTFGDSVRGSSGTFERSGRPAGIYSVGYGTVLIRRGEDLHGHVTSVSPTDHVLYLSTETYRCEPGPSANEAPSASGSAAR